MKLADSHPGGKSPTLIERIRAQADAGYAAWMRDEEAGDIEYGRVEGMCAALGILCGTTEELQWDSVVARHEDRKRRQAAPEMEEGKQEDGQGND